MSSAVGQLVRSRLRESFREPETIFWTFLFPPLLAAALGIAFRGEGPDPAHVVVVQGDGAAATAAALGKDKLLEVEVLDPAAAERQLRAGRAAILVVPGPTTTYRYDPSRAEAYLARAMVDTVLQRAAGRTDPRPTQDQHVTQPGARYIDFLIPGLLGMNLMGAGLWGIGWTIVEARTRRLLRRLMATPMRRRDFLLAQILSRLVYLPFEVIVLLGLAWAFFDVSLVGSPVDLAVVVVVGSLSFAGLGTLLASRARTTETINGLINLFNLPMFLLSGVFFSSSRFPDVAQPFIRLLPLTALNDALRAVINEGTSILALGPELLVLVVWGLASFALAVKLFRWTI
jgi:ABC-2 type transport system permease protein